MGKVLLSAHVVAAIIFVGPVTVAVSLFPRYARLALAHRAPPTHVAAREAVPGSEAGVVRGSDGGVGDGDPQAEPVVRLLHRIGRVYVVLGLTVPVLGVALAVELDVLGDAWLLSSIALTLLAAVLLAAVVLPAQQEVIALLDGRQEDEAGFAAAVTAWVAGAKRLSMSSGVFSLLWVVVVVLMVVRPGSTTGV